MRAVTSLVAFAVLAAAAASHADSGAADVRLPPGSRSDAQGGWSSSRGLRETSDWMTAELRRRGIDVQQIGPYGVRGVELTRFISRTASTTWLAIHVVRISGKTLIFFVPRAKSTVTP